MGHVRSQIERDIQEMLLVDIFLAYGGKCPVSRATEELNAVLAAAARARAKAMGADAEQTAALEKRATVSRKTVDKDLARIMERVRHASELGAAGILDQQLETIRRRIEEEVEAPLKRLRDDEEQIRADLDRSRTRSWKEIEGDVVRPEKKKGKAEPTHSMPRTIKTRQTQDAATAQLYAVLIKCHGARERLLRIESKLRQEERLLHFGRQHYVGTMGDLRPNTIPFAQALLEAQTPEEARRVALRRFSEEVERLQIGADAMAVLPAEVQRAHGERLKQSVAMLTAAKSAMTAFAAGDGAEDPNIIEVVVRRD